MKDKKRVVATTRITPEERRALRLKLLKEGKTIQGFLAEKVREYLEGKDKGK